MNPFRRGDMKPPEKLRYGNSAPFNRMQTILDSVEDYPRTTFTTGELTDFIYRRYGIRYAKDSVTKVLKRVPTKVAFIGDEFRIEWKKVRG